MGITNEPVIFTSGIAMNSIGSKARRSVGHSNQTSFYKFMYFDSFLSFFQKCLPKNSTEDFTRSFLAILAFNVLKLQC